jgi:hypothetical protein
MGTGQLLAVPSRRYAAARLLTCPQSGSLPSTQLLTCPQSGSLRFRRNLEALNDPKQQTAVPFTLSDFVTYSLVALAILAIIRLVPRPDPRKALVRKWTARLAQQDGYIRTSLRLPSQGTALIETTVSKGTESRKFSTQARWQLLDNKTLYLWGTRTATWKILKLNSWTMITADQAGADFPVRWTTHPRITAKPWLMAAAAVLLPVLMALSLPRSQPSHAIADDPQYVFPDTSRRSHR